MSCLPLQPPYLHLPRWTRMMRLSRRRGEKGVAAGGVRGGPNYHYYYYYHRVSLLLLLRPIHPQWPGTPPGRPHLRSLGLLHIPAAPPGHLGSEEENYLHLNNKTPNRGRHNAYFNIRAFYLFLTCLEYQYFLHQYSNFPI